jgi:tetratricopeptide (TPR) repeat protein
MEQIHARYNRIIAFGVFAVSFVIFLMTVAPTVAFWDCGEYIAAGHSLGVPHPPGNPFFMLLLRVSSILFSFFKDVGYRMNFLVVLFSAGTALFIYLSTVRIVIAFLGELDTSWKRLTAYTGGIVGGLFAVFGSTFWFSAVEASEANPAMFFVAISTWLVMVWSQSKDARRDRYLVLLTYLSFLGIGVHMYSMIVLPPIFLFILHIDKEKRTDWRVWLTACVLGLVIKDLMLFIWVGPTIAAFTFLMSRVSERDKKKWAFCFWLSLFAVIGFSTHLFIPIRSGLEPMINENHPSTWPSFVEYLQRKQYGSEDMFSRMFWRRGELTRQFGIDGHMGYGGFHITQFFQIDPTDTEKNFVASAEQSGLTGTEKGFIDAQLLRGFGKLFIYLIPTALMLFGWYHVYKKNRNVGIFLIAMFLISSVAMVFYMNFADGTRPEYRDYLWWLKNGSQGDWPTVHREVRVRDYFFAAAFMYLGMWIGIAASAIMHCLFTSKNSMVRTACAPIAVVLFLVSPVLPITQNWEKSSRKNDWVPYDYAYNLLMSCEKNGILFTNGDNDTFPLWALQEAYGVRKDVRIVNLSLLNTKWYIKQLKKLEPKVPVSYTENQIDKIDHSLNPIVNPTVYNMPEAKIDISLPTRKELNALRVQDQMVVNIVDANKWQKPIYFAVTVSDDNLMGLGPYLKMQGLAYRVMPYVVQEKDRLDVARSVYLLDSVFQFRGLGDGTTRLNDTSEKLMSNYAASYIQIALSLREPLAQMKQEIALLTKTTGMSADSVKMLDEKKKTYEDTLNLVVTKLDQCDKIMPWDWRPKALRHEILISNDRVEEAEKKIREALVTEPENEQYLKMLVQALDMQPSKKMEANEVLKKLRSSPEADPWYVYASLAKNYQDIGMLDSAIYFMQQFANAHPGDRRPAAFIDQLKAMSAKPADTSMKADTTAAKAN